MKIYCVTIISTYFNPKELKVSPKDQIYTMPSHWRMSDVETQRHAITHGPGSVRSGDQLTTSNRVHTTPESHRC